MIALCRERGMSLRAIGKVIGKSHVTVINDLRGMVSDLPPEVDEAPAPLPKPASRLDRAREMRARSAFVGSGLGVTFVTLAARWARAWVHHLVHLPG